MPTGPDASFTYTLTDGDGDTDTAKQTVKVNDGAKPTVSSDITIALDEEALGNASTPQGRIRPATPSRITAIR